MKTKSFPQFLTTLIVVLSLVLSLNAQTSKEAKFNVGKGDLLDVSLTQGNIDITTGSGSEVKVLAKNIEENELKLLTMEKKGTGIKIKFDGEDSDNFELNFNYSISIKS